MKKLYLTAVIIFVLCLSQCTEDLDSTYALEGYIDKFYKSIEVEDPEGRIELLAEDVILLPNHWTVLKGKEEVSKAFRIGTNSVFKIKDRVLLRMEVSGEIGYTVNSYFYTWHKKGEPPQWHKTKNVHIWRRNEKGQWQLTLDIWNSDVPVDDFALEGK